MLPSQPDALSLPVSRKRAAWHRTVSHSTSVHVQLLARWSGWPCRRGPQTLERTRRALCLEDIGNSERGITTSTPRNGRSQPQDHSGMQTRSPSRSLQPAPIMPHAPPHAVPPAADPSRRPELSTGTVALRSGRRRRQLPLHHRQTTSATSATHRVSRPPRSL